MSILTTFPSPLANARFYRSPPATFGNLGAPRALRGRMARPEPRPPSPVGPVIDPTLPLAGKPPVAPRARYFFAARRAARVRLATKAATRRMCSGPVPQQPPIMFAPASISVGTWAANSSGVCL
jgi:hypothetical protein